MLATAHYSCYKAIALLGQCELSGYVNWTSFWRQLGGNFLITTNVDVYQTLCATLDSNRYKEY